jgi:hypothetical protein
MEWQLVCIGERQPPSLPSCIPSMAFDFHVPCSERSTRLLASLTENLNILNASLDDVHQSSTAGQR